jgi:hypothetical protein
MFSMLACFTGPRVTLLVVAAVISMLALMQIAERKLFADLQVAAALQAAQPSTRAPKGCENLTLSDPSGALESFDPRPLGYGAEDALKIICAMEANDGAGKRSYLDRHFPLDMIFLLLYGPALAVLWLFLMRSFGWHATPAKYFFIMPILASVFDMAENFAVRSLVSAGPPVGSFHVQLASTFTQVKFVFVAVSLVPTFALLLWYLFARSLKASPV